MDRPTIPPGAHVVPIIGQEKFVEHITFELAGFKFHPPAQFDQTYVLLMVLMSGSSSSMYKTISAFQKPGEPLAQVYLAEDCDLGKKHDLVMVVARPEGAIGFMVAKPPEDDPETKTKH